ncbi:MAG: OsmC family protein [Candidatus Marinimicrobia bacterium]|nr:OsmC family protein [Candidatus Neomarinimicrobiota bacterium]
MKIEVFQAKDATLISKADSNHWVVMDSSNQFGGSEAATKPMEMLLMSLGGCTGMDVISLLKKMKVDYHDFRIEINGDRGEEYPKPFIRIELDFYFKGTDLESKRDKIEKAVFLSRDKYCGVSAMLSKTAEMVYHIHLE